MCKYVTANIYSPFLLQIAQILTINVWETRCELVIFIKQLMVIYHPLHWSRQDAGLQRGAWNRSL